MNQPAAAVAAPLTAKTQRIVDLSLDTLPEKRRRTDSLDCDEVQVVDPPQAKLELIQSAADENDDVCAIATKNQLRLSYLRQDCTEFPFAKDHDDCKLFCSNCFCYVCDTEASKCTAWNTHCVASNQGPFAHYWRQEKVKRQSASASTALHHSTKFRSSFLMNDTERAELSALVAQALENVRELDANLRALREEMHLQQSSPSRR